jgi:hypothetical protein
MIAGGGSEDDIKCGSLSTYNREERGRKTVGTVIRLL